MLDGQTKRRTITFLGFLSELKRLGILKHLRPTYGPNGPCTQAHPLSLGTSRKS